MPLPRLYLFKHFLETTQDDFTIPVVEGNRQQVFSIGWQIIRGRPELTTHPRSRNIHLIPDQSNCKSIGFVPGNRDVKFDRVEFSSEGSGTTGPLPKGESLELEGTFDVQ